MNFAKYISVIAISMIKFAGGPIMGLTLQLGWIETAVCSVVGMMLMVTLIVFFSDYFQRFFKSLRPQKTTPKRFTKMTRLGIKVRRRFGIIGIALLTPILFTPILGTVLATAFRYPKKAIFFNMLFSAIAWAIVQTLFLYFVKDLIF